MTDKWGGQAVVSSKLPDLGKEAFEDAILNLWADSIEGKVDPKLVATACVVIAMQYANCQDFSIRYTIAEVVEKMK